MMAICAPTNPANMMGFASAREDGRIRANVHLAEKDMTAVSDAFTDLRDNVHCRYLLLFFSPFLSLLLFFLLIITGRKNILKNDV